MMIVVSENLGELFFDVSLQVIFYLVDRVSRAAKARY